MNDLDKIYDWVGDYNHGIAIVVKDGKYGAIDLNGIEVIPLQYDKLDQYDGEKVKGIYKGQEGYVNRNGTVLIRKNIFDFVIDHDDYYSKWIFVELPTQFDWGTEFVGNYVKVTKGEKFGIAYCYFPERIEPPSFFDHGEYLKKYCINREFKDIIPPIYDNIDIVKNESEIIEFGYDYGRDYEYIRPFCIYTFSCTKGGQKFLIDHEGCIICEFVEKSSKLMNTLPTIDEPFVKWGKEGAFNGLSIVQSKENDKFGCIDKMGNLIIPMEYLRMDFSNGFITAYSGGHSFVFDASGDVIFEMEANDLEVICRNVYIANSSKIIIAKSGDFLEIETKLNIKCRSCSRDNDYIRICGWDRKMDECYGIINIHGQILLPFEFHKIGSFEDGLSIIRKNKYYGVVNSRYEIIIPCLYKSIAYDKNSGIFISDLGYMTKSGEHILYVNNQNLIIDSKYRHIDEFINGVAIVDMVIDKKLKYSIIGIQGEEILPPIYSFIKRLSNGMLKYGLDGKVGVFDKLGKCVIPNKYLSVGEYENGLSCIISSADGTYTKDSLKEYGYMDWGGNIVLSSCSFLSKQLNGLSVICRKGTWGFYEVKEQKLTIVEGVSFLGLMYDGLAKANYGGTFTTDKVIGGKWGFVDRKGKIAITPMFDYAFNFSDGIAAVRSGDKYGFIDTVGTLIVPCEYDRVESHFNDGEGELVKGDKIYVFDRTGKIVTNRYIEKESDEYLDDDSPSYSKYGGYNGFDDRTIDEAFDGDPSLTWNID